METKKNLVSKTLNVMVGDVKDRIEGLSRKGYNNLYKGFKDFKEDIEDSSRCIYNFGESYLRGLLAEQIHLSAAVYTKDVRIWSERSENFFGIFLGILTGAAIDSLTLYGGLRYLAGFENFYTETAAIVAGTKLTSNLILGATKWVRSSQRRASKKF